MRIEIGENGSNYLVTEYKEKISHKYIGTIKDDMLVVNSGSCALNSDIDNTGGIKVAETNEKVADASNFDLSVPNNRPETFRNEGPECRYTFPNKMPEYADIAQSFYDGKYVNTRLTETEITVIFFHGVQHDYNEDAQGNRSVTQSKLEHALDQMSKRHILFYDGLTFDILGKKYCTDY